MLIIITVNLTVFKFYALMKNAKSKVLGNIC